MFKCIGPRHRSHNNASNKQFKVNVKYIESLKIYEPDKYNG